MSGFVWVGWCGVRVCGQDTWNAVLECVSRLEHIVSSPSLAASLMAMNNQVSRDALLASLQELATRPLEEVSMPLTYPFLPPPRAHWPAPRPPGRPFSPSRRALPPGPKISSDLRLILLTELPHGPPGRISLQALLSDFLLPRKESASYMCAGLFLVLVVFLIFLACGYSFSASGSLDWGCLTNMRVPDAFTLLIFFACRYS